MNSVNNCKNDFAPGVHASKTKIEGPMCFILHHMIREKV